MTKSAQPSKPKPLTPPLPSVAMAIKRMTTLRRSPREGGVALEAGPTPERLARCGEDWQVGEHHDAVVERISEARIEQTTVKSNHIRVGDAPFDRLVRRALLAPNNSHRNALLGVAGERYRELWILAGLGPIRAQDLTRERTSAFSQWSPWRSQSIANNRIEYRKARLAVLPEHRMVLDEVVLAEVDLITAGRNATGRRDDTAATAVAVDRLACACASLARHWGILGDKD
jgi:hypothetical protein